jgi:hypothetical protein
MGNIRPGHDKGPGAVDNAIKESRAPSEENGYDTFLAWLRRNMLWHSYLQRCTERRSAGVVFALVWPVLRITALRPAGP